MILIFHSINMTNPIYWFALICTIFTILEINPTWSLCTILLMLNFICLYFVHNTWICVHQAVPHPAGWCPWLDSVFNPGYSLSSWSLLAEIHSLSLAGIPGGAGPPAVPCSWVVLESVICKGCCPSFLGTWSLSLHTMAGKGWPAGLCPQEEDGWVFSL